MQAARRVGHERASTLLASRRDDELAALVGTASPGEVGVGGGSAILDLDGMPVFAKWIPLTDREMAHPYCTANLFDLPLFCQYGIGSPGFGGWRELTANRLVTNAALAGGTSLFPLLHHWRVLPGRPPVGAEHADVDTAVAALGASPFVRARLEALAAASHSLVLFFEYLRYPLVDWLGEDPIGKAPTFERQLAEIVTFLRGHRLLHMDAHFGNMRSDGANAYLTDFGLATSSRFDLSRAERDFVARHADHDSAYASMRLVNWLVTTICGVPVPATGGPVARNEYVRRCAAGHIPDDVPPTVAAILARHAPAAATMNAFYWNLFGGDLNADYPAQEIDRTLHTQQTQSS
jgi:hypothetical protein